MTQGRRVDQLPKSVAAVADCLIEIMFDDEPIELPPEVQKLVDRAARQILERALAAGEL